MRDYPADYEGILSWMLERVPEELDRREGSLIYVAVAPIAAAIAEQRFYGNNIMDATMADTAMGADLERRCAEHGVNRYPATQAVRRGSFTLPGGDLPAEVAPGDLFGAEGLRYIVTKEIDTGVYELTCEAPGNAGNVYFGPILPIGNSFLGSAQLGALQVPGEELEPLEEFRQRLSTHGNSKGKSGRLGNAKARDSKADLME